MKVVILAGGYGTRISEESRVRPKPMAIGAKPLGARLSVAPKIIIKNINVMTISVTSAETRLYPPGECSP